jgi:hypothetical protein
MLDAGLCRAVLIAALSDANPILRRVARASGLGTPLADVAVCGIMGYEESPEPDGWHVLNIQPPAAGDGKRAWALTEGRTLARYEFDDWTLKHSTRASALAGVSPLTASGAVACLEAMSCAASRDVRDAGGTGVDVIFEAGGRVSGVSIEKPGAT